MVSNSDLSQFAHLLGYRKVDQWAAIPNDYQFRCGMTLFSVSLGKDKFTEHGYVANYTVLSAPGASKLDIIAAVNKDYDKYGAHSAHITYL